MCVCTRVRKHGDESTQTRAKAWRCGAHVARCVHVHAPAPMDGSRRGPAVPRQPPVPAGSRNGEGTCGLNHDVWGDSGLAILGSQLKAV